MQLQIQIAYKSNEMSVTFLPEAEFRFIVVITVEIQAILKCPASLNKS